MDENIHQTILKVDETVQAGDVILIRSYCPECNEPLLTGLPLGNCSRCLADLSDVGLDLEGAHRRVLSGTRRKKTRFGKRLIQSLLSLQHNQCAYCDHKLEAYEVEHITPLAVGGTNNYSNLCLSCRRCNSIAGAKWFPDFYTKREYVMTRRKQKGDFK